jgi:hypothetical protein
MPGTRYAYRAWLRRERRAEAEVRRRERSRIACLSNYALARYLTAQADCVDVSWISRVNYRAAFHEAVTVRGWSAAANPKL